jgi:hypothetical protein
VTAARALAPSASAAVDDQNPWPGLASFDEASQRFFNGRRAETGELRQLILTSRLAIVFGASGLGKTSLLQAGLFPLIRRDNVLPIYIRLDVRDTSAPLIDQVRTAMLEQFAACHVEAPPMAGGRSLWEWLHTDGIELWSDRNRLLTPLFVFDQFEEVFTLGAENAARIVQFKIDLADLIENRIPSALADRIHDAESAAAGLTLASQALQGDPQLSRGFPAVRGRVEARDPFIDAQPGALAPDVRRAGVSGGPRYSAAPGG